MTSTPPIRLTDKCVSLLSAISFALVILAGEHSPPLSQSPGKGRSEARDRAGPRGGVCALELLPGEHPCACFLHAPPLQLPALLLLPVPWLRLFDPVGS